MKIDIYSHIMPRKYVNELSKRTGFNYQQAVTDRTPTLWDLNTRFRIMDKYEGLQQVLTVASPPVESVVGPRDAVELTRIANDEMAEMVREYPDRFIAAVACLPMNDLDAALRELERAVKELNFKGVQLHSPLELIDKPLDHPDFIPLYERVAGYDLPIWIHPKRGLDFPDYRSENQSKYFLFSMFGWPYETTSAMARLIFGGILERFPNLKVITHHCGGMVPYFVDRIVGGGDYAETCRNANFKQHLSKPPIEYYRMFYVDTAMGRATSSLIYAYDFFGADHIVFATDMSYDRGVGDIYTKQTIAAIDKMEITDAEKKKIYEGNARRLLRIPE